MDCAKVLHNLSAHFDKCQFVCETDSCQSTGFIEYTEFVYCDVPERLIWLGILPWVLLLALCFIGLSTAADSFFCPNLAVIVDHLKLSHNIAGVTFLAFGNGAPDIFSSIASIVNNDNSSPGLAFGALLGFIVLYFVYVIVVGIGRYVRKRMQAKERVINEYKEGTPMDGQSINGASEPNAEDTFYKYDLFHGIQGTSNPIMGYECESDLYSVTDSDANLNIRYSGRFELFFEFWTTIRPFSQLQWKKSKWYQRIMLIIRSPVLIILSLTIPVVDFEKHNNGWSKILTAIHCTTSPVFALCVIKKITYMIADVCPLVVVVLIFSALLTVIVVVLTNRDDPPRYHKFLSYAGFLIAILWIYSLAREIVNLLTMFGIVLNVSQEILGLTVLAWSNSLGDLISDLTVASQGYPRMAISACFGGPLFNLLLGIGIPFTIMTAKNGGSFTIELTPVAEILCIFLSISLISSFIILPASKFRATRPYAVFLLMLYVLFVTFALLTELKIIDPVWPIGAN